MSFNKSGTTLEAMSGSNKKSSKTKPLSAYNIFFRYTRIKLLEEFNVRVGMRHGSELSTLPGLEDLDPNSPLLSAPEQEICNYRMQVIENTLEKNSSIAKKKCSKKSQGFMNFIEMSNYMSQKWNNSDESTKRIFQKLSSERKAKAQKLEFDSYKKSARRFSLTMNTPESMANKTVTQILSGYNLNFNTISPSSCHLPRAFEIISSGKANAIPDEPFPVDDDNIVDPMENVPPKLIALSSGGPKQINFVGTLPITHQNNQKACCYGCFKSVKPMHDKVSKNTSLATASKHQREEMDLSNFDWEEPFTISSLNHEQEIATKMDRPISPVRREFSMDDDVLGEWLSSFDWD